jgi:GT2 family glycosyltransferase
VTLPPSTEDWWHDEEAADSAPIEVHHFVTAIVVSRAGAEWLPRTLQSLRAQTRPVDQLVAVDVASEDASITLLQSAGAKFVAELPSETTQGQALLHAEREAVESPGKVEWIWVIHDDSAPEPQALEKLLHAANLYPQAAVVGCKVVDWEHGRHVLEVGSSITAIGTRFTGLESGERDQGQHDQLHPVHAVSTAGMLIRRDVWRQLEGFAPELPHFRTELEFCWRVWESGSEVIIEPAARIRHAAATIRELRKADDKGHTPHLLDRQAGAHIILSRTTPRWAWARMLLLLAAGAVRSAGYALVQDFFDAREEWRGTWRAITHPSTFKALRARAGTTALPAGIRATNGEQLSHAMTELVDGVERWWFQTLDNLFPDRVHTDEVGFAQAAWAFMKRPSVILAEISVLVGLIITRSGWGAEQLTLPGVGYVPSSAIDLWSQFIGGWHAVGMGTDQPSHPLTGLIAVLSLFTGANPAIFVVLLSALGPWLSGLSLHLSLRSILSHNPSRVWLAALYGLSPVVLVASATGDIAVLLAAILLPATFVLVRAAENSWRAAAGAGLSLAVLASIWPAIWLIAIVLLVLLIWRSKPSREIVRRLTTAIVWSIGIMMPWSLEVVKSPARLFTQFGVKAESIAPAWQVIFGADRANAATPWWWGLGLALVAVAVLVEERTHRLSRFAWVLVGASLAVSVAAQLFATFVGGAETLPALSIPTLLITAGLVLSLASSVSTVRVRLTRSNFGWRQISTAFAVIVVSCLPIAGFATTIEIGSNGTGIHREAEKTDALLRGFTEELQLRTLVLETSNNGAINAYVFDGRAEFIGDDAVHDPVLGQQLGADIAQWLTTVTPDTITPLRKYAIGYIAVPSGDTLARKVSSMGNLTRLITSRTSGLLNVWRVTDVLSRAYLNDGMTEDTLLKDVAHNGESLRVQGIIIPSKKERAIHLADRAEAGWSASLDGVKLEQTSNSLLTWKVPAGAGGTLLIEHDEGARIGWLMLAAISMLSVLVVLAPRRRNSYRDEWLEEA